MERKDIALVVGLELSGLALFGIGLFDSVATPTPPYEAVKPDPAYTLAFNATYRLRSTILLGAGSAIVIGVPLSILAASMSPSSQKK